MKLVKRIDWSLTLQTLKVGEEVKLDSVEGPEATIRSAAVRLRKKGIVITCSHYYGEPIVIKRLK